MIGIKKPVWLLSWELIQYRLKQNPLTLVEICRLSRTFSSFLSLTPTNCYIKLETILRKVTNFAADRRRGEMKLVPSHSEHVFMYGNTDTGFRSRHNLARTVSVYVITYLMYFIPNTPVFSIRTAFD